jgi:hypothetical protein
MKTGIPKRVRTMEEAMNSPEFQAVAAVLELSPGESQADNWKRRSELLTMVLTACVGNLTTDSPYLHARAKEFLAKIVEFAAMQAARSGGKGSGCQASSRTGKVGVS